MKKKRGKPISVASRKGKGRMLQQWVCRQIAELTGYEYGKDCPIESRPMGQSGCDVRMEAQVKKLFPFSVECKRQETWSLPAWIEQAKENQMKDTDWLLVIKRNNEQPLIVMDAEKFFTLLYHTRKQ